MNAKVIDGPYAGRTLDHNDLKLYCELLLVGLRKFFAFPPLDRWDDVRHERMTKEESWGNGEGMIYELERTPSGIELRLDHDGTRIRAAQTQATGPQPSFPPPTGKHYECVRSGQLIDLTGTFPVTDEKDRAWDCKEVAADYFPELVAGRACLILHAENLDELRRKLSDHLD